MAGFAERLDAALAEREARVDARNQALDNLSASRAQIGKTVSRELFARCRHPHPSPARSCT